MMSHRRPSLTTLLLIPAIQTTILSSLSVSAYIPAVAINDTSLLNLTDSSSITISWTDPPSVYSGAVSYQLEADIPTGGTTQGALVHFTESSIGPNFTTSTPWIAYVSCDVNETMASQEWDIFTLARDRGAVSALLYTATSASCLLNQEYIQDFEKPLDVFATKTVQVARVIDNQWIHTNDSFYTYNGTLLNASGIDVNNSIAGISPSYRTFLIGTLTARNSTGQASPSDIPNSTNYPPESSGHKTPGSMIALYVIIGLISLMFILMVYVGARRALRHPERYGRREATDAQGPQSTASGIAQAILDTFPVIKFNSSARPQSGTLGGRPKRISSEANFDAISLPPLVRKGSHPEEGNRESALLRSTYTEDSGSFHSAMESGPSGSGSLDDTSSIRTDPRRSLMTPSASRHTSGHDLYHRALMEETPGTEEDQCPICLIDFETGDDLRVLPCEGGHKYHQSCIDPWLLEVSGSCPLCRKDFNNPTQPADSSPVPCPSPTSAGHTASQQPPTQSGFARYLAFMRRERRSNSVRRPRAGTGSTTTGSVVGRGRRREADQTGPGGY